MTVKIAIGSLQCESNTCSPIPTRKTDFDLALGEAIYQKVHVNDLLEHAGATVVPTLYAHALPGGAIPREDYLWFVTQMVESLPDQGLDGIWLYLHGALFVEGLGSGETYLLRAIREKVGDRIPISLALDFHANMTDELCALANVICGFRTAPHVDQIDTERKAMRLLLHCIEHDLLPKPQMARPFVLIPGDAVQTGLPPMRGIIEESDRLEKLPGMLCAQVFGGQQWVDSPFTGPSVVVTHGVDHEAARSLAYDLAKQYWDVRHDFSFLVEALEPKKALEAAMHASEQLVFISDSGDNTTAGAAGDNAYFLRLVQESSAGNVLVAGIVDTEATSRCRKVPLGSTITVDVGASLSSESDRVEISGEVVHIGEVLGYTGEMAGMSATVDCGRYTVVITEQRAAFTREDIFRSIDLDVHDYHIVVVKLGYLFPDLARIAERSILAFTPGTSAERIEDIGLRHIGRPMYPFDDDFFTD